MKAIIFGLGNPGTMYDNTRHNFGRKCVQEFIDKNNLTWITFNNHGEYSKYNHNGDEIYLLRTTNLFMNESGLLIQEFANYYKIDKNNIIILYDDMDTSVGKLKLKLMGSAGGHNGMKDVIKCLQTNEIKRVKLGINRPTDPNEIKNYVLAKFKHDEIQEINKIIKLIIDNVLVDYVNGISFEKLMSKYN